MITAALSAFAALDIALSIAAARRILRWLDSRARIRRRLAQTRNALTSLPEPSHGLAGALAAMRAGAVSDAGVEHAQQMGSPFGFDRSVA